MTPMLPRIRLIRCKQNNRIGMLHTGQYALRGNYPAVTAERIGLVGSYIVQNHEKSVFLVNTEFAKATRPRAPELRIPFKTISTKLHKY